MVNIFIVRLTCFLICHYLARNLCDSFMLTDIYLNDVDYWNGSRMEILKMVVLLGLFIGIY
jgi:hypothetical protein